MADEHKVQMIIIFHWNLFLFLQRACLHEQPWDVPLEGFCGLCLCFHNICFCTDNVMSHLDGIVLVQCLWVYWPTACLILFIEKCIYQNMEPRYLIQILLGSPVGLGCLFQWFLWFSGSSSSEYHSVYLDACTLVKANLFGDLTFSVGYSLSMWIAIQLQLDSNSV
jgi:hypothetical protein